MTAARAQALVALAVGLLSVIIARLAVAPSAAGTRRGRAALALAVGLIGTGWSAVHLANSTAIGTGSGRLGAIVALAVGLIGTILGGRALARAR